MTGKILEGHRELKLSSGRASSRAAVQAADLFDSFLLFFRHVAFFVLPAASAPAGIVPARCYRRRAFLFFCDRANEPIEETHLLLRTKEFSKMEKYILSALIPAIPSNNSLVSG
jgi:hypothetical protein